MNYDDLPKYQPEENSPEPEQVQTPGIIDDEPELVIDAFPPTAPQILSHIPSDAGMDDATITYWNGTKFVSWPDYMWEQLRANAGRPITDQERRRFEKEKRRLRNRT